MRRDRPTGEYTERWTVWNAVNTVEHTVVLVGGGGEGGRTDIKARGVIPGLFFFAVPLHRACDRRDRSTAGHVQSLYVSAVSVRGTISRTGSVEQTLLTDAKRGRPRRLDTGPITPLKPEGEESAVAAVWRPAAPRDGESVRWESSDGRWIIVGLASGSYAGKAIVRHSSGLAEYVDSYEAALRLAREWQTL